MLENSTLSYAKYFDGVRMGNGSDRQSVKKGRKCANGTVLMENERFIVVEGSGGTEPQKKQINAKLIDKKTRFHLSLHVIDIACKRGCDVCACIEYLDEVDGAHLSASKSSFPFPHFHMQFNICMA